MKKALAFLFLTLPIWANAAAVHEAEYGVANTFNFELYTTTGVLDVDEADGGAEVTMSCDEAAETGVGIGTFVNEGTFYSIALDAAAMSCARIVVIIAATDTNLFFIETYGHPDAQNPCPAGNCITFGTAQVSTVSSIVLKAATSFADNFLVGAIVEIVAGTGAGQTRTCTIWVLTSDTCTVNENWDVTPTTSSKYFVRHDRRANISVDANGRVDVGSVGGTAQTANDIGQDANDILTDTGTTLPATLATVQSGLDSLILATGTCDSGSTTTCVDAVLTEADADYWQKGVAFQSTSGTTDKQTACVYDFAPATDTLTFRPALTQAISTNTYALIAAPTCGGVIAP